MNEKTKTLIISFLIMAAGMTVNYTARVMGRPMPLSYTIYGGEIIQEIGFGLQYTHIYSMEPNGHDTVRLGFDAFSFIVTLAGIILIVSLLQYLIKKYRKRG